MTWQAKKNIVVPVDLSEVSRQALDVALSIIADGGEVHAIYVLPSHTASEPGLIWNVLEESSHGEQARQVLTNWLVEQGVEGVHVHTAFGDAGERVLEFAEQSKADMIVLNSHGRRGIARFLIGSVAERVLRHAHCPVLVLKNAATAESSAEA